MNPEFWGNGTWFFIFIVIFKYYNTLELLKRLIYKICENLPCKECVKHSLENLSKNNIISCDNSYRILLFFVHLRNQFKIHSKKNNELIDISEILSELKNNENNLTKNIKILILSKFCYTFNRDLTTEEYDKLSKLKIFLVNK